MAWVATAPERYERTSREDPPFVPAGRRTSGELRWLESQHSQPGWRRRARTNTAASRAGGSLFPHRAAEVRLGVALCVARRIRPSLSSPRRRRGASRRGAPARARTLHPNLQRCTRICGCQSGSAASGRAAAGRPRSIPRSSPGAAASAEGRSRTAPLGHPRSACSTDGRACTSFSDNDRASCGARRR